VKAAAAEADAVELRLLSNFFGKIDEDQGEARMETTADVGDRLLTAKVAEQPLEKRKRTNLPV